MRRAANQMCADAFIEYEIKDIDYWEQDALLCFLDRSRKPITNVFFQFPLGPFTMPEIKAVDGIPNIREAIRFLYKEGAIFELLA